MKRVIAYVDGFNLYHGLREKGWKKYYWLNVRVLIEKLLAANQRLVSVKYFTALVTQPPDKERRQSTYLEALATLADFYIIRGKYIGNISICTKCKHAFTEFKEKMTDVNIAVEMISDVIHDEFDVALLLSADSDLVPVVKFVKTYATEKKLIVFFPPSRHSIDLEKAADSWGIVYKSTLKKSVFPDEVRRKDGFILQRPAEWS